MEKDDAISALNHLVAIAKDGVNGMKSAAESAQSPLLKQTLEQAAQQRDGVASQLQQTIRALGGNPDDSGTIAGTAHRAYMNLKEKVTGSTDKSLLEECERGEDVAMNEFRQALDKGLPADAQQAVRQGYEHVKQSHNQIRTLRDTTQS